MDSTGLTGDLFALPTGRPDTAPPAVTTPLPKRQRPVLRAAPAARPDAVSGAPAAVPRPARQLWLALDLPALALGPGTREDVPVAVVDDVRGRPCVIAVNALAARAGVQPGLGLETALALAPALEVEPRSAALEARRLEELARLAGTFSPLVCVEPPDGLLLEIRGSCRLFGGLQSLVARLTQALAQRQCVARLGIAPTPRAAVWLARAGEARPLESEGQLGGGLGRLPLGVTRWPESTQQLLARLGLRVIGDLVRLPRAGIAQRFTVPLLAELDEAYGRRPAVRRAYRAPERFATRRELDAEIESQAWLEPVLHELLDELGRFLERRAAGVAGCAIRCEHRGRPPTVLVLRRRELTSLGTQWHRLLHERLARLVLPAPVRALSLRSGVLVPLPAATAVLSGLADPAAATAEAGWLIDRLQARLGEAAVAGIQLVPGHRPESATRHVLPAAGGVAGVPAMPLPAARRPLWLLREPKPLGVRDGRPWLGAPLILESGPERIESGWWDGADVCRDYYVARPVSGPRLWIYRELGAGEARWFWHGLYA